MFQLLATTLLLTILTVPAALAGGVLWLFGPWAVPLALLLFVVAYGLVAGALSLPFHGAIQAGRFDRDLSTPLYRGRRLYGLCWTAVYYCPPVLHGFLAIKPLKRALCRLFGCPALADATFYPDTWLRDLPLLELGEGAYLANRATIGTNTVLTGGRIMVGRVRIGRGAVVGHLAAVGQGTRLGDGAELGFRTSLGMRSRVGARSRIGATTAIGFGTIVGDDVVIGVHCFLGDRVRVGDGLVLPANTWIPDGTNLRSQRDVEELLRFQTGRPLLTLAG